MPTYEYLCEDCGYQFEAVQRITDEPLKECPSCKGKVKRLISCTNFLLKGEGWYKSGYVKGANKESSNNKETKKESKAKADAA